VNLRPTFFGCDPTQTPPEFPLVIYFPNAPPVNGIDPVTNTGAFKTSYTILHQNLFLDQCFSLGTSGFVANTTSPDANFPQCLQCAAIDRARLRASQASANSTSNPTSNSTVSPIPRSDFCQRCFTQYCYNPNDPPSAADIPGRKVVFVDPDPASALSKAERFVEKHGVPLFIGIGVGVVLLICVCAFFGIRARRRRTRRAKMGYGKYKPVVDNNEPWQYEDENDDDHQGQYAMAPQLRYNDPYNDTPSSRYHDAPSPALSPSPSPSPAQGSEPVYDAPPGHAAAGHDSTTPPLSG